MYRALLAVTRDLILKRKPRYLSGYRAKARYVEKLVKIYYLAIRYFLILCLYHSDNYLRVC